MKLGTTPIPTMIYFTNIISQNIPQIVDLGKQLKRSSSGNTYCQKYGKGYFAILMGKRIFDLSRN